MEKSMKFCTDCSFYKKFTKECSHPLSQIIDIVTGVTFNRYARDGRRGIDFCKPEAIYFQPKSRNWLQRALKI